MEQDLALPGTLTWCLRTAVGLGRFEPGIRTGEHKRIHLVFSNAVHIFSSQLHACIIKMPAWYSHSRNCYSTISRERKQEENSEEIFFDVLWFLGLRLSQIIS